MHLFSSPAAFSLLEFVSWHDTMFLMNERTIGQNIRRLREAIGQTLTDTARAANLTKSTLSKIEKKERKP